MRRGLLVLGIGVLLAAGDAWAGPATAEADSDADGVNNSFDNCRVLANPSQADTDHDGCGNACQPAISCDLAGDMNYVVGAGDQAIIGMNFGMTVAPGTLGDCDGNGVVGASDLAALGSEFLNMVGPSGISTAQCHPSTCNCIPQ